jgi:hypothetical protein
MKPSRRERLDAYDAERLRVLVRVAEVDEERLRDAPDGGEWSVLQTLQHLVLAERVLLLDLPDVQTLRAERVTAANRLAYAAVLGVLRGKVPVPLPDPAMEPDGSWSLEEVSSRWQEDIDWLGRYLDVLVDVRRSPAVFRHPVAGPLTVDQVLRLAPLHLAYHLPRMRRLLVPLP